MASTNIETVNSGADKAKLAGCALLVLGLALAVVLFLTSYHGKVLTGFGRDAYRELHKVVWPTRKEASQMTLYVFGFVFIMALMLWFTDKTLEWVFYDLILGWKK